MYKYKNIKINCFFQFHISPEEKNLIPFPVVSSFTTDFLTFKLRAGVYIFHFAPPPGGGQKYELLVGWVKNIETY